MLFDRLKEAKKNLGLEAKLIEDPNGNIKEEVVIGQDYIDETDEIPGETFEDPHKDYKVYNNGLDGDEDVLVSDNSEELIDKEFKENFTSKVNSINKPNLNNSGYYINDKLNTPTKNQKEESMDKVQDLAKCTPTEDTSGNTKSNIDSFLEKYADGNDIIQVLRKDLMAILSDMQWIIESNNTHEQWALDFADAINEISVKI